MRRICVVTGSRSEYGLLASLLRAIEDSPKLKLSLIATGTHLSARHGMTVSEIEADGRYCEKVDIGICGDAPINIAQATGRATSFLAEAYARIEPDLVVVLGDRYEILGAASAALLMTLPLAHIHGGEVTVGAIDESIRHAISKMANLHFTSAEPYRLRLINMGENPARIFSVGALAADNLRSLPVMNRDELSADIGLPLIKPILLITYHPTTAEPEQDAVALDSLLATLEEFPSSELIFTGVNADAGGYRLAKKIEAYVKERNNAKMVVSLGRRRYLSLLRISAAVIGNSSSGMTEAPMLGVPTVNIGDRQKGRLRPASVIDCQIDQASITAAIGRALDPDFRQLVKGQPSFFGDGYTAERIVKILAETPLDGLNMKFFHDV
jgi:UDP-N-acetylglucosamine 2-epimerase (non-hydrolysing)